MQDKITLSVVVPCFNERNTLKECVERLLNISDETLSLEIVIVDDCSTDGSSYIGKELASLHSEISFIQHNENMGKGAALRTGFKTVKGDFVAIQDADLEYDPKDLKNLLSPLISGKADVVIGSRFLTVGPHRVLYFWHSMGNKLITFISNMLTDLNLTDIESGYKIFKREIIQKIRIEENRFGFEPEIIAKLSHMNLKIYEMGVSYFGRTYEEGKKIGYKDGFHALYCIFRYNIFKAPNPIQFSFYFLFSFFALLINLVLFKLFISLGIEVIPASLIAFGIVSIIGYPILRGGKSNFTIFAHGVYKYILVVLSLLDAFNTNILVTQGIEIHFSKVISFTFIVLINFFIRRYLIFASLNSRLAKGR